MSYDKSQYLRVARQLPAAKQPFYDLGGPRTQAGRALFAQAWMAHDHFPSMDSAPTVSVWPRSVLGDLLQDNPDDYWQLILTTLSFQPPDEPLYALALRVHELLVTHGEAIMAQIEAVAPTDPIWARLLGALRRAPDLEPYWSRIARLRGPIWELDPSDG